MLAPVDVTDLVSDQRICGGAIRHAQQRLGQTHQRHTFFGGEPVSMEKGVYSAGIMLARAFYQLHCKFSRFAMNSLSRRRLPQTFGNTGLLCLAICVANLATVDWLFHGAPVGKSARPCTRFRM